MDFTTNYMIKPLLIVRYKFGYMVPNIPPFVGKFVCSETKYKLKELSIRNGLIVKLKYLTANLNVLYLLYEELLD